MSKTNCVNCGAAKDSEEMKCPFCGTLYFDMTALDLDGRTPVACVFKMPGYWSNVKKVTMLAAPRLEAIEQESPSRMELWADNRIVETVVEPQPPKFKIDFTPVMQKDGVFLKMYTDEYKGE